MIGSIYIGAGPDYASINLGLRRLPRAIRFLKLGLIRILSSIKKPVMSITPFCCDILLGACSCVKGCLFLPRLIRPILFRGSFLWLVGAEVTEKRIPQNDW